MFHKPLRNSKGKEEAVVEMKAHAHPLDLHNNIRIAHLDLESEDDHSVDKHEQQAPLVSGMVAVNDTADTQDESSDSEASHDYCGMNFSGMQLKYKRLMGARLYKADFSNAVMIYQDLQRARLCEANLSYAAMLEAQLNDAYLCHATLIGTDLRAADLTNAHLTDANLFRVNLGGAILTATDLRRANLSNANLAGTRLEKADLRNAKLIGATLRDAELKGATLQGTEYFPEHLTPDLFKLYIDFYTNQYTSNFDGEYKVNKALQYLLPHMLSDLMNKVKLVANPLHAIKILELAHKSPLFTTHKHPSLMRFLSFFTCRRMHTNAQNVIAAEISRLRKEVPAWQNIEMKEMVSMGNNMEPVARVQNDDEPNRFIMDL